MTLTPSTQAGLTELGHTYRYAAQILVDTLAVMEALCMAASDTRSLTAAQSTSLHQLTREFLQGILDALNETGTAILAAMMLERHPNQIGAAGRQRLDQLSVTHAQQMQTILRRES